MKNLTYGELIKLPTFEERFEYLKLSGRVGDTTFGSMRYLNQAFYRSREWKLFKQEIIVRDNGCDLGVPGYEIYQREIYVHHLIPVTIEDFDDVYERLLNPENVITTTLETHNAIHYGSDNIVPKTLIERVQGDTCLWKRGR